MKPGPLNTIADVDGLLVGQAEDREVRTGVTVVTGPAPFVAGVSVMGGAPGTRETDLLAPDRLVQEVDALVLSGGSAFGLDACSGAMAALAEAGRGYPVGETRVPIVPGAILFDLGNGGDKSRRPYAALGQTACARAGREVAMGSAGAGFGATTAGLRGGLGSASAILPSGIAVGALVAVNALGSAVAPDGARFWAGAFEEGEEFGGLGPPDRRVTGLPQTKLSAGGNTTIAVVATDATLTQAEATRMAVAAQDGMARALLPSHTPADGDLVFAAATARRGRPEGEEALLLGHVAATCLARAIARAVYLAAHSGGIGPPAWSERFG